MADPNEHWTEMWQEANIPWQRDAVDVFLKKYLQDLTNDKEHASILITLCGKSLDLPWLCTQGHTVVGVELSEVAATQLFEENSIPYSVSDQGKFKVFVAKERNLSFYAGDFFELSPTIVGTFDAIWDHHAFSAINPDSRTKYITLLFSLLKPRGRILLSNFEYETKHNGAPYSLPSSLVKQLFEDKFEVELKERIGPDAPFHQRAMKQLKVEGLYRPIHLLSRKH